MIAKDRKIANVDQNFQSIGNWLKNKLLHFYFLSFNELGKRVIKLTSPILSDSGGIRPYIDFQQVTSHFWYKLDCVSKPYFRFLGQPLDEIKI